MENHSNKAEQAIAKADKAMERYILARGAFDTAATTLVSCAIFAALLCILPG